MLQNMVVQKSKNNPIISMDGKCSNGWKLAQVNEKCFEKMEIYSNRWKFWNTKKIKVLKY